MRFWAFLARDYGKGEGAGMFTRISLVDKTMKLVRTCKTNEEAGDVEHVGREARLVMIHVVLLARLVSHDVE